MEEEKVSLATLAQGAAVERFDYALREVLTNIQDPNTDWKQKRTINLKVIIEPDEDRQMGKVTVACDSKMAPVRPFALNIFMGRDSQGKGVASEANPRQNELFRPEVPALVQGDKVYKIAQE